MADGAAPADGGSASWHEVAADDLANDEAGSQLLHAAAALVASLPPAQIVADRITLAAKWSEQYIDSSSHVDEGAYDAMIEDETRTPLFAAAIARRLCGTTDVVVVDIGTGPKALLALMAARAGARRVFAIEANPVAVTFARATIAAAHDVPSGVVEVIQGFSTDVTLPELADLLVAELVGSIASEEGLVQSVRDAQARHLKWPADPRSFIPRRVQTLCAPASHVLAEVLRPPHCATDYTARRGGRPVRVGCCDAAVQLMSPPQLLEDMDLTQPMPTATGCLRRDLTFEVSEAHMRAAEEVHSEGLTPALLALGTVTPHAAAALTRHLSRSFAGLACWPRLVLDDEIVIESRTDEIVIESRSDEDEDEDEPGGGGGAPESHWQTVLPLLSARPLRVDSGDVVRLEYCATFGARVDEPLEFTLRGTLARAGAAEAHEAVEGGAADDGDEYLELDFARQGLGDHDALQLVRHLASHEKGGAPMALLLEGNSLARLPDEIGDLRCLTLLALNDNHLTALPEAIGRLHSLQSLELSGNQLTTLPAAISELRLLHTLRLGGNRLRMLPNELCALPSVHTLGLNCNQLGELPFAIGRLRSLRSLRLHGNVLAALPAAMGELAFLTSLAIGGNQIQTLPAEMCALSSLETLGVNCNLLSELPAGFGRLRALQALTLDGNRLHELPNSIGSLPALTKLSACGNALGELPSSIGQLSSLTSLSLAGNALGELPASIGQLSSLTSLNLTSNRLDALPDTMGGLISLRAVLLPANNFASTVLGPLRCQTMWIEAGVQLGPGVTCANLVCGTSDRSLPYVNFHQTNGAARASVLVVAFGVSAFDFGGVISRSGAAVDVLFLFDERHSSFMRDDTALRTALARMRSQYGQIASIGSSQSAFGALHYMDCVDSVLAISPLDSFVEQRRHLSQESTWLPDAARLQHGPSVTIHVAEDNFLDAQYVHFCEETHRRHAAGWQLCVAWQAGAQHPAYPGDAIVHEWLHGVCG